MLFINQIQKKESLFCLTTPLEHIDFYIIGYWTSSIWSLWHISLEETRCCHIGIFYMQTGQHIPQPLMDQLWTID